MKSSKIILAVISCFCSAHAQSASGPRSWVDQQGRAITATFVSLEGTDVVLQLPNGTTAKVPLSRFSAADQAFARQQPQSSAPTPGGGSLTPALPAESKSLVWPETVTVNAKDLQITTGEQEPAARRFVYQSGSFQFTSQAPLTGTVMREIAGDFELVRTLFAQLPWGWQPKPKSGNLHFPAILYETEKDFIAGGGSDNSSGGSKGDHIYTKFSTLGLKKVGERYAFDSKLKRQGEMVGLISRLLTADMRGLMMPWASFGMEDFFENVAYRNGSFALTDLDRALKARIETRKASGCEVDLDRMLSFLERPWSEPRSDAVLMRSQYYLDGTMLFYFFGYLDDAGKGARLHHYFHSVAQDSLAYRSYNESGRKTRLSWRGTFAERAAELNKIVLGNRTREELREAMQTKFKSIGVKL